MAVLSVELVQRLVRERSGRPVVSLYLNVDGKENIRHEDCVARLESVIREANLNDIPPDVKQDLDRIADYVRNEFSRGNNRGLAVFSSGDNLWEVVPLTVPVEDRLVINSTAHVRSLETILDEYESAGVLLTDKQRTRMLIFELGRVVEREEFVDPLPRHDDDGGDWGKDHVKTHATVTARQHVKHAAQAMFELYQRHPFDNLLLCAADELAPEVERQLHTYLRSRIIGHCNLPIASSDDEIAAAVLEFSQKAERLKESVYVDRLRAAVGANAAAGRTNGDSSGAVAGLEPTLKAVFERRVDTLLVSEGYATEGWRCGACSYIATIGRRCPMCGSEMNLVQDIVEEAVEDALGQKCRVEFCSGNADLDVLGRIGALLRF